MFHSIYNTSIWSEEAQLFCVLFCSYTTLPNVAQWHVIAKCSKHVNSFVAHCMGERDLAMPDLASMNPACDIASIRELVEVMHGLRVTHDEGSESPDAEAHLTLETMEWVWGHPDMSLDDDTAITLPAITCALLDGKAAKGSLDRLFLPLSTQSGVFNCEVATTQAESSELKKLIRTSGRTVGRTDGKWFLIISKDKQAIDDPIVVVYNAITAHYCLCAPQVTTIAELAIHLSIRGVRFSLRCHTSSPFLAMEDDNKRQNTRQAALAKQKATELKMKHSMQHLTLGWRPDTYTPTPFNLRQYLHAVRRWCTEYPQHARIGLRCGGFTWRLLSSFVDIGADVPLSNEDALAMPPDMCIERREWLLVDGQLTEREVHFLAGAYECYREGTVSSQYPLQYHSLFIGRVDHAKSSQMVSWLPRFNYWDDSTVNKQMWTPESEAFWQVLVQEWTNNKGQPRTTKQWKEWSRGHNKPDFAGVEAGWREIKQVGA
jgi:hypothetical protein